MHAIFLICTLFLVTGCSKMLTYTSVVGTSCLNGYFNKFQVHYTTENVVEGKAAAKRALQQKLGLQQNDVPIVGIISRLTAQKGIHLIKHAMRRTLERNGQVDPSPLHCRLHIVISLSVIVSICHHILRLKMVHCIPGGSAWFCPRPSDPR